ncbi:MAG: ferredoxin reductase [Gammaproteobacteria bacterium]
MKPSPRSRRPAGLQRWISPKLFDFWAGQVNPLWSLDRPLARLVERQPAGRGAATLVLRTNRHWQGLRAGQHVNLGVEIEGRRLLRSYSPTPLDARHVAITVKAVEGGKVSGHLVERAVPGEVFTLEAAFGDMVLPDVPAPLLLLAAGSGITPMRALLRELAARGMPVDVDLLYWARTREDFCFADELQALARVHPRLRLELLATRDAQASAPRIGGYAFERVAGLSGRHAMACGPAGFATAARQALDGQVARFQAEAFTPETPLAGEDGEVEVQLARSGRRLRLPRALSLLEGLEAQGLKPKHGCRMGICNSCACGRQTGTTRHVLTGERSDEPAVPVRLCVNAPSTDLILDL